MELRFYKLKFILLIALLIVIYLIPLSYIEGRSFCVIYNTTGIRCFGCGFTRAFFNFTRLNIYKSIEYNKMIMLLGPMFVAIYLYEIMQTISYIRNGKKNKSIISKILKFIIRDQDFS